MRAPKAPLREEVRPLAPSAVEALRAELSQAAGLGPARPYDLRHSFASLLLTRGAA